mgnify:CR=1 FL=1
MANDTDQPDTLAKPRAEPLTPTRPPRELRAVQNLLAFQNVQAVLALGDVAKLKMAAEFRTGEHDAKIINVGDGGSVLIVVLTDNPAGVGDRFWDIRPPRATE